MDFMPRFTKLMLSSLCLAVLFVAACGGGPGNMSRGKFVSYIEGSRESYESGGADFGAHIELNQSPASEYNSGLPEFDLWIKIDAGDTQSIRLSPLVPDNVEIIDKNTVRLISTRDDNALQPVSDNSKMQGLIQSVEILVEEEDSGTTKCWTKPGRTHYGEKLDSQRFCKYYDEYSTTIRLYKTDITKNPYDGSKEPIPADWPRHLVGKFYDGRLSYNVTEKVSANTTEKTWSIPAPGMASGKGLYTWLRQRAQELAKKKAKK